MSAGGPDVDRRLVGELLPEVGDKPFEVIVDPGAEAAARASFAAEVLLGSATRELHLARLGEEIQATSRRINALEQPSLPALSREAARVEAALEERDREDAVRRRRFRARRAGEDGTGPRP